MMISLLVAGIILLLVTGYIIFFHFKLKADEGAKEAPELDSVAELKSAFFELDNRVRHLLDKITALHDDKDPPPG